MIKYQIRPLSRVDLTIQILKWKFPIPWRQWIDWSTIRSRLNKKEWDIIECQDKMRKLLADRSVLFDLYLREMDEAEARARVNFGKTEPLMLTEKEFNERIGPYCDQPDDTWISFYNPKIIREFGLNSKRLDHNQYEMSYHGVNAGSPQRGRAGTNAGHNVTMPGHNGAVSGYTLKEFADKAVHIGEQTGVDQVVAFREDQGKSNPSNAKERLKQLRIEHPQYGGESANEWNNRLQRILKEEQGQQGSV